MPPKVIIAEGVTRTKLCREMLIGIWNQPGYISTTKHQTVFINYFTKVFSKATNQPLTTPRTFSVEMFLENDTTPFLNVMGPVADLRGYTCEQFYVINASVEQLIDIGKRVANSHGDYSKLRNNCRHFATKFLKKVQQEYAAQSATVTSEQLTKWIQRHDVAKSPSYYTALQITEVPVKSFSDAKGKQYMVVGTATSYEDEGNLRHALSISEMKF